MENVKNVRQLERHFKGIANHHRLNVLFLISEKPGVSLEEITNRLEANYRTMSEHVRRLVIAGLVYKTYHGRQVAHTLSPYGEELLKLVVAFQHS